MRQFFILASVLVSMASASNAHDPEMGRATAILNEGVIVEQGGVKILFDPIYDNGFNAFPEQSEAFKQAIIEGASPYDGVDAIFVSHFHGDHFSTPNMLRLMKAQSKVRLYAPAQAVEAMKANENWMPEIANRVEAIDLKTGEAPVAFMLGETKIEAIRTPHIGWPNDHLQVENITFRVSLAGGVRVMHMGDADTAKEHFSPYHEFFSSARSHLGFVPFWFFDGPESVTYMDKALNIRHAVGIHTPIEVPESLKKARKEYGADYFSKLGETRYVGETEKN